MDETTINKIYLCIHPYCWSWHESMPEGRDPERWNTCLEWELRVHELHLDFVSRMSEDEVLVVYHSGDSEPQLRLHEHGRKTLGRRYVVLERRGASVEFLADVPDPIRRFLDDDDLPGKREFVRDWLTDRGRRDAPSGLAEDIEAEIREACTRIGFEWSHQGIKVPYGNRTAALEIEEKLEKSGLRFDPGQVDCLSFGEGFEECAMTWKAMLPQYMGLARPVENDFGLSVSGAPFLAEAGLSERIDLGGDTRLFLWGGEDGRPIGLFCRAAARLRDVPLLAAVPRDGIELELWNQKNERLWPEEIDAEPPPYTSGKLLNVPVMAGLRRGRGDEPHYVIGTADSSSKEFRERLVNSEIAPVSDARPWLLRTD